MTSVPPLLVLLLLSAALLAVATAATAQEDKSSDGSKLNIDDDTTIPTFHSSNEEKKASDYANYFSAYADLYHQKIMLTDHHRMRAYYDAIMKNSNVFKDKVVLDVGSGSGILAVWAAKAGAKRVYAVEYTDMAKHARNVVKANGVDNVVTVIQGAVEDVQIPSEDWDKFGLTAEEESSGSGGDEEEECSSQKKSSRVVDIIISEWMGYFLLRESMLDSVIRARDLFLKPTTGILLPSHATMLIAPINNSKHHKQVLSEYTEGMDDWHEYLSVAKEQYGGVDMSILEEDFEKEQRDYYLLSSHWVQLDDYDKTVLATPVVVKTLDMKACTLEDAKGVDLTEFTFDIAPSSGDGEGEGGGDEISGFAGWFTVDFQSRADEVGKDYGMKMTNPVHFTSSPEIGGESVNVVCYPD